MAKKKTEDTTPEEIIQDIKEKQLEEFLDEPKEEPKAPEEPEAPKDPPEPPVVEPPKEDPPVIDPDKLKEDIKKEISKETVDKISKALGVEETTPEQKDKYQQLAEDFQEKHNRAPKWFELIPQIVEDTKAAIKAEQDEAKKLQEDNETKQKEAAQESEKAFNKEIDDQIEDLSKNKKLPAIDPNNDKFAMVKKIIGGKEYEVKVYEDEGRQARQELFQTMMEVNIERVSKGLKPVTSIKEVYYEHYKPSKPPAGADAPISAGRGGSVAHDDEQGYTYDEIHTARSFFDILMGRK